jgi:rhodanese-related sulfurtransferase
MKMYDNPKFQEFHIEGIKHIHPKDAFDQVLAGKAIILDVRETDEIKIESVDVPDTLCHPLSVIIERLQFIPKEKPIYVLCAAGIRSSKIANLLNRQNFPEVANIDGGLAMWKASGLPFQSNKNAAGSCGCGCSCSGC